jgi:hypothetical protein
LYTGEGRTDGLVELEETHKYHKDKPIIHAETGKTRGYNQTRWLIDAFRTIKSEMPELKAWVYWDNDTAISDPVDYKTLSEDSLQIMKEIFRDPYWIMAREV